MAKPSIMTSIITWLTLLQRSTIPLTAFSYVTKPFLLNYHQSVSTRRYTTAEIDISVESTSQLASTAEDRANKAKETWSKIALQPTLNKNKQIDLNKKSALVYNKYLFNEFTAVKGTYFVNGLSNCQIGDRLCHPFEAHGYCKSFVFDGKGQISYTSHIVETPLTRKERQENKLLNRGVMSSVANMDSIW